MLYLPTTMVSGFRLLGLISIVLCSASGAFASNAVLIEFASKTCQYCVAMQPVMERLTAEGIAIRHVDVDTEPALAVRYSVRHLPTYVIISGGKESARLVGKQPIEMVRQALLASEQAHLTPTNASAVSVPGESRLSSGLPSGLSSGRQGSFAVENGLTPSSNAFAETAPLTRLASVDSLPGASPQPTPFTTPAAAASLSIDQAVERAAQATVRLRIFEEDGIGFGVGTGTVIDARAGEYLILTCGHLFRDSSGKGRVEVDVFQNGQAVTVPGQIVDYDAQDRDIGLVSMQSPISITPVPVLPTIAAVRNGDSVFSYGCDRGADPSRRDTRITGIDKYNQHLKLSNLEIAGAPVIGRSGGGLFDKQGRLIGVCNAADYNDDIGIYAGPGEVYWQLGRVGMETLASASSTTPELHEEPQPLVAQTTGNSPLSALSETPRGMGSEIGSPSGAPISTENPDGELILIYRDRNRPSAPAQVRVIDRPTTDLLELLRR